MSTQSKRLLTPEEYLAIEREADIRSEFFGGEMFPMTGGNRWHSLIKTNISRVLGNQLRVTDCTVHCTDLRVKVSAMGLYTYPDILVACGDPQFDDEHIDTLLNPIVIFEVLSPSTEAYDRGDKWKNYRKIESLREYVLVAQDAPRVGHFTRHDDSGWLFTESAEIAGTIELPSISCRLSLQEIYERVDFTKRIDPK